MGAKVKDLWSLATEGTQELMQVSLLSLKRSCAAYAAKAIRLEAWSKRCFPFAITVNIIDIQKIIYYGNSN